MEDIKCVCICSYANGLISYCRVHITIAAYLMKGDHDDHLTWPARGILTVQLLNQINECSDSNHSETAKLPFNGSSLCCHRVIKRTSSDIGACSGQFMPHKRLSYDADKNCQYFMNDCVFFRVCNFQ